MSLSASFTTVWAVSKTHAMDRGRYQNHGWAYCGRIARRRLTRRVIVPTLTNGNAFAKDRAIDLLHSLDWALVHSISVTVSHRSRAVSPCRNRPAPERPCPACD